jgi:hypothetical protein
MLKKIIVLLSILILSIFIIQAVPTQKKTAEFHDVKFIGDLNCRLPNNISHPNSVPTDNTDKSNTPDNKANPTFCCPTLIVNCSCTPDKGNRSITPPFPPSSIDSAMVCRINLSWQLEPIPSKTIHLGMASTIIPG